MCKSRRWYEIRISTINIHYIKSLKYCFMKYSKHIFKKTTHLWIIKRMIYIRNISLWFKKALDANVIFVMIYDVFDFVTIFVYYMRRYQFIQTLFFFDFRIFRIINFWHRRYDSFNDEIHIVINNFIQKMIDDQ